MYLKHGTLIYLEQPACNTSTSQHKPLHAGSNQRTTTNDQRPTTDAKHAFMIFRAHSKDNIMRCDSDVEADGGGAPHWKFLQMVRSHVLTPYS